MDVRIKNFKIIEDASIKIEGITLLQGESNNGKTSIYDGIETVVLNKKGDDYIRKLNDEIVGEGTNINIGVDNHNIQFKKKKSAIYYLDDQKFSKLGKSGTPEEIDSILRLSPIDIEGDKVYLNFYEQQSAPLIKQLSEYQIYKLIVHSFDGERIANAISLAKSDLDDKKQEVHDKETKLDVQKQNRLYYIDLIDKLTIVRYKDDYSDYLRNKNVIQDIVPKLDEKQSLEESKALYQDFIDRYSDDIEKYLDQIYKAEKYIDKINVIEEHYNYLVQYNDKYKSLNDVNKELNKLDFDTLLFQIDSFKEEERFYKEVMDSNDTLSDYRNKYKQLNIVKGILDQSLNDNFKNIDYYIDLYNNVKDLSGKVDNYKNYTNQLGILKEAASNIDNNQVIFYIDKVIKYDNLVDKLSNLYDKLSFYKDKLVNIKKDKQENDKELEFAESLLNGGMGQGIQNKKPRQIYHYIQE